MALSWATPNPFMGPEEQAEDTANRHGQVQEVVAALLAAQPQPPSAPAPRPAAPVKPEHLQRALDLVRRWDRLCELERAAHNPPPGVARRVHGVQIKSLGLDRYDFFDLSDLQDAGIDVGPLSSHVVSLAMGYLRQARNQVCDELNKLGVDTMAMVVKQDKSLDRLINNPAHDSAPPIPTVQP
jgi:hypothetical protein